LRIGIVLPSVPGYSETFFKNKILGLQQRGFEVLLFVKNGQGRQNYLCPVKVHPNLSANSALRMLQSIGWLLQSLLLAPKPTFRMWSITKSEGYAPAARLRAIVIAARILPEKLDWLHFGFATAALEREFIGKAIGSKVAVSVRGYDISVYPIKHKSCYNQLWKNIDKFHSISDDLFQVAINEGLKPCTPYQKITPAIDCGMFEFKTSTPSEPSGKFRIVTVGRLHWKKGLEYTMEALALLRRNKVEFEFTIIGDGPEKERLVFAAYQLGIIDYVNFKGVVSHAEIPHLLDANELYIQYSIQEGFCNAVLEAQAKGLLCIVSNAEGLSENILHNQTGWVVPRRRPDLLAKQIKTVFELSNAEKDAIRHQARDRVAQNFNLMQQQQAFVDFYTT
jgi:glycosyltransferase involved in cell wall biosynthesis